MSFQVPSVKAPYTEPDNPVPSTPIYAKLSFAELANPIYEEEEAVEEVIISWQPPVPKIVNLWVTTEVPMPTLPSLIIIVSTLFEYNLNLLPTPAWYCKYISLSIEKREFLITRISAYWSSVDISNPVSALFPLITNFALVGLVVPIPIFPVLFL